MKKILIYGYGNPGRQDDALGILLVEHMERWAEKNGLKSMDFDSNYQLNIEDALAISEYDFVIFADASIEDISDFILTRVEPSQKTEFTMHAMSPEFVLHLCHSLYNKFPETYLLHLKGYEFDFLGELTKKAERNLNEALSLLQHIFSSTDLSLEMIKGNLSNQADSIKIS